LPAESPVWVAGSTHAGEEEQVVAVSQRLLEEGRPLVLILVPRHPERCRAVGEMLAARGITYVMRSQLEDRHEPLAAGTVLLGDTLGEMLDFYAVADLVFVGGSLVPVGGHNVLEGALLKKPVLFGPHMHNFKEISALLSACGGGMQVADGDELALAVGRLLDHPGRRNEMGEQGHRLLQKNVGATAHTMRVIRSLTGN
jgi:3-deoxy-D-manno-octulosonic-acid transferase